MARGSIFDDMMLCINFFTCIISDTICKVLSSSGPMIYGLSHYILYSAKKFCTDGFSG